MTEITETPRTARLYNLSLKLTAAQLKLASQLWRHGSGTQEIAGVLAMQTRNREFPEHRVYNSLDRIKRQKPS